MKSVLIRLSILLLSCFLPMTVWADGPIFLTPLSVAAPRMEAIAPSAAAPATPAIIATQPASVPLVAALPVKDSYVSPTMPNLAKMYIALGQVDLKQDEAIDNFLLINECDMYMHFYNNDLEWNKIRAAARESIKKNLPKFSTRLEVRVPIKLGRYNEDQQYFDIAPQTILDNSRRFEVSPNQLTFVCGKGSAIPFYPRNLILNLDMQLTIKVLPMTKQMAKIYMTDDAGLVNTENLRDAFVRLKVNVTQFINTELIDGDIPAIGLAAQLEGVDVFADADETKLLYTLDTRPFHRVGHFALTNKSLNPYAALPANADFSPQPVAAVTNRPPVPALATAPVKPIAH